MWKIFFFSGIVLIVLSGILFTLERFVAVFYFASEPMAGIFDNFLVGLLLVIGLSNVLFGLIHLPKK